MKWGKSPKETHLPCRRRRGGRGAETVENSMAKCQGDSVGLPLRGKLTTLSRKDPHLPDMRHRKEYWDKCWARPLISALNGTCEVSLGPLQNNPLMSFISQPAPLTPSKNSIFVSLSAMHTRVGCFLSDVSEPGYQNSFYENSFVLRS